MDEVDASLNLSSSSTSSSSQQQQQEQQQSDSNSTTATTKRRKTEDVESAASNLASAITEQFKLCSKMSSIDISALAAMNNSVEAFHAALQERVAALQTSAHSAQRHADASRPLAHQMNILLQKTRHLEAVIDRLDEYTIKQEAALTNRTTFSPSSR